MHISATIPNHDALKKVEERCDGELGKDVRRQFQADHSFALKDRPFANNVSRHIVTTKPDSGNHHQEIHSDGVYGGLAKKLSQVGIFEMSEDQAQQHTENWRLNKRDDQLPTIAYFQNEIAANQRPPLAEAELANRALSGRTWRRWDFSGAVGDKQFLVARLFVGRYPLCGGSLRQTA